jgi:hypothetical protein
VLSARLPPQPLSTSCSTRSEAEVTLVRPYQRPGHVYQCDNWPRPLDKPAPTCQTTVIPKENHMETLSLDCLALLDALEADLDADLDFDADEVLDEEV